MPDSHTIFDEPDFRCHSFEPKPPPEAARKTIMKAKVVWLAPYPVPLLAPAIKLAGGSSSFHPSSWLVNLSKALAVHPDIDLHIVIESTRAPSDQVTQRDGITFHVVKSGLPIIHRGFPPYFPVDILTRFASTVAKLLRKVHELKPDLVHAHGTEGPYALAGVRSRVPCLISIQGVISEYFKTNPDFRFRIVRHYEQSTVRQGRFFTCRTDFDTGFVRSQNPQARIFTIHEAMNPLYFDNEWRVTPSETILFVGSPEPRKGLPILLEALALVRQRWPRFVLNVVGKGPPEAELRLTQQCAALGIADNVTFHGFRPAEEIAKLHLQSQVFALPSQNENSPNALAEAMVSGMPVIATRVGGIASLVEDGQTGLLVPWGDAKALAGKIEWLLAHPEERERLGQNARRVARQRHAPQTVAAETVQAYKEILATHATV
jgi:glycosyltransferase involved in cell wall biosynthesis